MKHSVTAASSASDTTQSAFGDSFAAIPELAQSAMAGTGDAIAGLPPVIQDAADQGTGTWRDMWDQFTANTQNAIAAANLSAAQSAAQQQQEQAVLPTRSQLVHT